MQPAVFFCFPQLRGDYFNNRAFHLELGKYCKLSSHIKAKEYSILSWIRIGYIS